jgi:hypothetical protein
MLMDNMAVFVKNNLRRDDIYVTDFFHISHWHRGLLSLSKSFSGGEYGAGKLSPPAPVRYFPDECTGRAE